MLISSWEPSSRQDPSLRGHLQDISPVITTTATWCLQPFITMCQATLLKMMIMMMTLIKSLVMTPALVMSPMSLLSGTVYSSQSILISSPIFLSLHQSESSIFLLLIQHDQPLSETFNNRIQWKPFVISSPQYSSLIVIKIVNKSSTMERQHRNNHFIVVATSSINVYRGYFEKLNIIRLL